MSRYVAHFDMDAFFAAIEERNNPRFAGRPIIIGADPKGGRGRGVVSTANYPARAFGIGSGMAISRAWQLAEMARGRGEAESVFLPGSWPAYSQTSAHIMSIIRASAPIMQKRSVDEAYADLSSAGSLEQAAMLAREVQKNIYEAEQLTVSVGIGPNKLIAKIASDYDKPNGFTVVDASAVAQFLAPLPVRSIPGIGPQTEKRLVKLGITTVADLQRRIEDDLVAEFGSWGRGLYRKARGIDDAPVTEISTRKSIGEQRTFDTDTTAAGIVIQRMGQMAKDVFAALQQAGYLSARTITITVRFHDFQTTSSAHTTKTPAAKAEVVEREAIRLLLPFLDSRRNPKQKAIRLIGIRLEKLA